MSIQDWMSQSRTRDDGDTSELSTEEMLKTISLDDEQTKAALDHDDDEDFGGGRSSSGGFVETALDWGRQYWYYPLAGVALLILAVVMLTRFTGSGAPAEPQAPPDASEKPAAVQKGFADPSGPVKDTGVELAKPVVEKDTYYLRSGDISWKGKVEETDTGEELTLEGPTAAQFKRSVALPHGEIMTGVFGRAQPDQPIVHGTFHRVTLGEQETTSGTYKAVDGEQILADGYYDDERDGDTIVRTYRETIPSTGEQNAYRVSFQAPAGVPIPTLIGWEPPPVTSSEGRIGSLKCSGPQAAITAEAGRPWRYRAR